MFRTIVMALIAGLIIGLLGGAALGAFSTKGIVAIGLSFAFILVPTAVVYAVERKNVHVPNHI